jgi:hypothetical protein
MLSFRAQSDAYRWRIMEAALLIVCSFETVKALTAWFIGRIRYEFLDWGMKLVVS